MKNNLPKNFKEIQLFQAGDHRNDFLKLEGSTAFVNFDFVISFFYIDKKNEVLSIKIFENNESRTIYGKII